MKLRLGLEDRRHKKGLHSAIMNWFLMCQVNVLFAGFLTFAAKELGLLKRDILQKKKTNVLEEAIFYLDFDTHGNMPIIWVFDYSEREGAMLK